MKNIDSEELEKIGKYATEMIPKWMDAQTFLDHYSEIGGTFFDKEEKAKICIAMVDYHEQKMKEIEVKNDKS